MNKLKLRRISSYAAILLSVFIILMTTGCKLLSVAHSNKRNSDNVIKLAMLHLDLHHADLDYNSELLEQAIRLAASRGAKWILTPELVITGYRFDLKIGTDWIAEGPDQYVQRMQKIANELNVTLFFSHLERLPNDESKSDNRPNQIFNTLFVINEDGVLIGRHRKINIIPISEAWSSAGLQPTVVTIGDYKVGLLICADAWPKSHAEQLRVQGADLIISSANWSPGLYGPKDTWEQRSLETNLPLFVNNRTGIEREFDMREAASVIVNAGERLLSHVTPSSTVLRVDWDHGSRSIVHHNIYAVNMTFNLTQP